MSLLRPQRTTSFHNSQLSIGFEEVIKEGSGTEVKRNKLV